MACHKLTEDAIKDLKKFYCRLCKSANPHLLAPRRRLPTDEAATYERRHCEDDMPHAVHSLHGVKEQAECVCDKPNECTTSFIQCAVKACKRWCHTECVSVRARQATCD
ncbi:hypothetical protein AAVH_02465 [Aphelenchoides avenae]|nr:hypothetical protein AAVH_02465 [Aphelenchus avenae]